MKAHLEYLWYVLRHKYFVLIECYKAGILWRGIVHDLSKFLPSEWSPYALSFYGPWKYSDRPKWLVNEFDLAWLHHQKRNKHHWQYWLLVQDEDKDKVLPMPMIYKREMLADWRGAGRAITGKDNTANWYKENRDNMQLHPDTRAWIERELKIE